MNNLQQNFSNIRTFEQYVQERGSNIRLRGNLSQVPNVWSEIKFNSQQLNQADFFVYLDNLQIMADLTEELSHRIRIDIQSEREREERESKEKERDRERQREENQLLIIQGQIQLANLQRGEHPWKKKLLTLCNIFFFF